MGTKQTTTTVAENGKQASSSTVVEVTCDFSGCSTKLVWINEDVQKDINALPSGAWRLISFGTFDGTTKGFCSKTCLLSFLREFVPLKSPKELAEQAELEKSLATVSKPADTTSNDKVIEFPGKVVETVPDSTGDSTEAS